VAGELYRGDWVYRFARMTGPQVPNGLQMDFALAKHYGDQIEIEHAHTWGDQPGKVRVLAWRNRAVLASYSDATAYLQAHPGTNAQSFFDVRKGEKIKYGLGVNLEQAITPEVGFFLRAMKADGKTETYAFTEVDDSLSIGVHLKGQLWGRANDVIGLAWLRNGLSKERRQFLEAGGISFFIGDGLLRYRPEQILETFYSWQVKPGAWLTADVQHIQNPAYNALRGPINVFALRAHAEF
jgi:carbohydrate-selective porin OprB